MFLVNLFGLDLHNSQLYQTNQCYQKLRKKLPKNRFNVFLGKIVKGKMDEDLKDLLFKIFQVDPNKRINIEEILQHRFFRNEEDLNQSEALPIIQEECHEFSVRMAYRKKKIGKNRKQSKMNGKAGRLMRNQQYEN